MATNSHMVPTVSLPKGMSQEEALFRGAALAQLNILKQQMELGKLTVGSRTVRLGNGVVVTCSICFNKHDMSVFVPVALAQNAKPPEELLFYLAVYGLNGELQGQWVATNHYSINIAVVDVLASKINIKSLDVSQYNNKYKIEHGREYGSYYPQYWSNGVAYTQWSAKNRYYRLYYSFVAAPDYYQQLASLAQDERTNSTSKTLSIISKSGINNIVCNELVYYAWLVDVAGILVPCYLTYVVVYSDNVPIAITPTFKYFISAVEYTMSNITGLIIDHSIGVAFDSTGRVGKGISKTKTVNGDVVQTMYSFYINPEFIDGELRLLLEATEDIIKTQISSSYDELYPYGAEKTFYSYAELSAWNAELNAYSAVVDSVEIEAIDYDSDNNLIKCFAQTYNSRSGTVEAIAQYWESGVVVAPLRYNLNHATSYTKYFFSDSSEYIFTSKSTIDNVAGTSVYDPVYYFSKMDLRLKNNKIYGIVGTTVEALPETTVKLFVGSEVLFTTKVEMGSPEVGVVNERWTSSYQPYMPMQSFVVVPKSSLTKDCIVFFSYQYALDCALTYCNIDSVVPSQSIYSDKFNYCAGVFFISK